MLRTVNSMSRQTPMRNVRIVINLLINIHDSTKFLPEKHNRNASQIYNNTLFGKYALQMLI